MLTVSEIIRVLKFERGLRVHDIAQALRPLLRETAVEKASNELCKVSEPNTDGREDG